MSSTPSSQLLTQRHQQLYGKGRCARFQAIQTLQQEDHVKQSFRRGVRPVPSRETFQSITARDYKGSHSVSKAPPPPWQSASQYETHLQLGSDLSVPMTTLVRSDFTVKPITQSKPRVPEGINEIHIADLAPRYMADKTFGRSLYNCDFDGNKSHSEWTARMVREGKKVGRRQRTTGYQKATHFELGSNEQSLVSETSDCFTGRHPHGLRLSPSSTSTTGVDRSKSNVFRAGDYNTSSVTPKDHFVSVQMKDYGVSPSSRPPAGVSMATTKGYSHVLPKESAQSHQGISSLRKLLLEKNTQEFQCPRDPTAINITKAFLKYDKDRSGKISVDELRTICNSLGTSITEQEITELLRECDLDGDGQLDYAEFTKYLAAHGDTEKETADLVSTNTATYSGRSQMPENAEENEFTGAKYQTSTHFHFGDEKGFSTSSLYSKDFDGGRVKGLQKQRPPPPPCSSKVMHEFPVVRGCSGDTTSRSDYVQHNVAAMERGRLQEMMTNKEKHKQLGADWNTGHIQDKSQYRESVMTSSYISPAKGFSRPPAVDPVPKSYHHLESDRALLHPPKTSSRSEASDRYVVPIDDPVECASRRRETLGERTARIKDNKQSHIFLGFDEMKQISEKESQFGLKTRVDSKVRAAGIQSLAGKGYSVIGHDSGDGLKASLPEGAAASGGEGLQTLLQQRNFIRNINPRDPLNVNIRKAFLEYDKDLSGTVSKEEVMEVCKKMSITVNDADLKEIMSKCSKNEEDQIDYHEFALHLTRQQPPTAAAEDSHQLTSITMRDFKPPQLQEMSDMQKLVLEQDAKRYVPSVPTHFYQVDPKEELCSTTRMDFIRPEEVV